MADADKDEGEKKTGDGVAEGPPAPKSLVKRLLPYLIGGGVSLGLGIGAGVVTKHKPADGEKGTEKKVAPTLPEYPKSTVLELPEQIFNCADTGQMVAGKVSITLEVQTTEELAKGEKKSALQALVENKDERFYGRIRDALVNHLSSKVSSDLKTARGKEVLKLEIQDLMNRILFTGTEKGDPKGVVTGVLFTNFLVQ